MIQETLRIKNLGPLRDVVMDDIRPVMVLVGATGSGKSLVLKVLAMMRHVAKRMLIRRALKKSGVKKTSFRIRRDSYLRFADIEHLAGNSTEIDYALRQEGFECRIRMDRRKFTPQFSGPGGPFDAGPFMKVAFLSDTRNLLATWERKGAAFQAKVLDNYFAETYALWDDAVSAQNAGIRPIGHLGTQLSVKGSGNNGGRREIAIVSGNGARTPFARGASGEKSSIPISVILRHLVREYDFDAAVRRSYLGDLLHGMMDASNSSEASVSGLELLPQMKKVATFRTRYLSIHVEEPELSLDPETQLLFADDLMSILGLSRQGDDVPLEASIVFATHSPYWVTALNTIAEERRHAFLSWERLGGYHLRSDGTVDSLRDEESHILTTPNMDAASEELDSRYNDALERGESDANY